MNINRFTQKAQDALLSSRGIAQKSRQFESHPLHWLLALRDGASTNGRENAR